eukprot:14933572-Alexandrium_andersonii.AAC.1
MGWTTDRPPCACNQESRSFQQVPIHGAVEVKSVQGSAGRFHFMATSLSGSSTVFAEHHGQGLRLP